MQIKSDLEDINIPKNLECHSFNTRAILINNIIDCVSNDLMDTIEFLELFSKLNSLSKKKLILFEFLHELNQFDDNNNNAFYVSDLPKSLFFDSRLIGVLDIVNQLLFPSCISFVNRYDLQFTINDYSDSSLFRIPSSLKYLEIKRCFGITNLFGLPDGLESLVIRDCNGLTNLEGLPKDLKSLEVYHCDKLENLQALPVGLKTLKIDGCHRLKSLKGLPDGLESLEVLGCSGLTSLESLPEGLKSLKIVMCSNLTSLEGLPEGLHSLHIFRSENITSLEGLPDGLKNLTLNSCNLNSLTGIPNGLTSLDYSFSRYTQGGRPYLIHNPDFNKLAELVPFLEELTLIGYLPSVEKFPASLKSLELQDCNLNKLNMIPENLSLLKLESCRGEPKWKELKGELSKLEIIDCNDACFFSSFKSINAVIEQINIFNCKGLTHLNGLPSKVRDLQITKCSNLNSIRGVPFFRSIFSKFKFDYRLDLKLFTISGCDSLRSLHSFQSSDVEIFMDSVSKQNLDRESIELLN